MYFRCDVTFRSPKVPSCLCTGHFPACKHVNRHVDTSFFDLLIITYRYLSIKEMTQSWCIIGSLIGFIYEPWSTIQFHPSWFLVSVTIRIVSTKPCKIYIKKIITSTRKVDFFKAAFVVVRRTTSTLVCQSEPWDYHCFPAAFAWE